VPQKCDSVGELDLTIVIDVRGGKAARLVAVAEDVSQAENRVGDIDTRIVVRISAYEVGTAFAKVLSPAYGPEGQMV
jgi:hypothetical protein